MSIRKINFVEGEYYHIYNRGNSKQEIFHDEKDYEHFVCLLYILNTEKNVCIYDLNRYNSVNLYSTEVGDNLISIGAYVLMPNHFHILITEKIEGGISKFMQKVSTAYVMYFNRKYKRTGSLFEGKFKSQHLGNDRYLKYIFSYIHLNPIKLIQNDWKENGIKNKKRAIDFLENYRYSSYLDFISINRIEKKIINLDAYPDYFSNKKDSNQEIFSWLNYYSDNE